MRRKLARVSHAEADARFSSYAACVPVLIAVGMFTLYHLWSLAMNTTTIEGWEKDKVAILKRRGRIREVRASLRHSRLKEADTLCTVQVPLPSRCRRQHHVGPGREPPLLVLAAEDGRQRAALPRGARSR